VQSYEKTTAEQKIIILFALPNDSKFFEDKNTHNGCS
jgi:hypothetical protein